MSKPFLPLLVSACLLGHAVRYDGGHRRCPRIAALRGVRWHPACPEVLAGFGVPRPPLELRRKDGMTITVRCTDGTDLTAVLRGACLRIARDAAALGIRGAVVKSLSPSCAAGGAPLWDQDGVSRPEGTGLLVQALRGLAPDFPVIDEAAFADAGQRADFLRRIGHGCPATGA
ncbi:MAG: DUF523 domain-containing protein [Deltaproteobacteria bacterium]|nr:DUF523 domain-containing protein [Deltaproteobacteria bacterium]